VATTSVPAGRLEQALDAVADDLVVVDQQDAKALL